MTLVKKKYLSLPRNSFDQKPSKSRSLGACSLTFHSNRFEQIFLFFWSINFQEVRLVTDDESEDNNDDKIIIIVIMMRLIAKLMIK